MILRIVRSNSPLLFLFFIILSGILWIPAFQSEQVVRFSFDYHPMPFYQWIHDYFNDKIIMQSILVLIILVVEALILLKINREYILLEKQNYLPGILFIILTSTFIQLQRINPAVFASFFIILMIDQLFSSYREKYILNRVFLAGMLIALASLFYFPAIFFFFIIWIALILLRSFNLREWLVPVLGILFPYLFVFAYYFIVDQHSVKDLLLTIETSLFHPTTITHYNIYYYIFYGFLGVLVIVSSFSLLGKLSGRKIYIRKFFEIFWWIFLFTLFLFFFDEGVYMEMIYFAAIPLTFLLADYFNTTRSRIFGNIFLFVFAGLIGLIYYINA